MTQSPRSLTRDEAEARSALLDVVRYDIAVDLRGLFEGEVLESTSTITFRCGEPGASTFVDCLAEVRQATLNGHELDLSTVAEGRIPLPDLAADNLLVVRAAQADTGSGAGILRTVDPSDKLVYVWTSFEADDARRAWACFDQPDLKAPHAFTVLAPVTWMVTSNGAPDSVVDAADGGRLWTFPDTPRLSTYVVVVNAGPFHELREERGGHSLGLYCRQSLKHYLERDAADLFESTEVGLAFFGERFGQPFPQVRYDQVFVPNMGGAMENWGCVTWTDAVLFRSPPTHGQRAMVNSVLLHEMAHMWFGDLVTMQWWDDLWLNEAFASWAATWAGVNATSYTDGWATFLAGQKLTGYQVDMGPASHPIRGDVPDVAQAMANFDAITYVKGESVLKQLVAYVGEDVFVEGLRAYFRDHAWGNTRLADLMSAVGTAAGRDLSEWTAAWFDRAGTDTLTLSGGEILAIGPDGEEPRPHHLEIGVYDRAGDALERVGTAYAETTGTRTRVEGLPESADLFLVNDSDLTFAAVRTDERSLRTMLAAAGGLPEPVSRALAVTTAWDMLVKGELATDELLTCVLGVLDTERSAGVVEPFLAMALRAAEQWTRPAAVPAQLARLADRAAALAGDPEHRAPALRTLAASASSPEHLALLAESAADDVDLAWRVLVRRSALGEYDAPAVEALLERDPDPEASVRALGVLAARPDDAAKAEVWAELFEKRTIPAGTPTMQLAACFWRPVQHDLMLPWAHRYLDAVVELAGGGMLAVGSLMRSAIPTTGDEAWVERALAIANEPGQNPTVRGTLLTGADTMTRVLRARS
jgi:aminopeptidase N